ncbi:MAG: DNA polymerase III subunit delta [Bacteroidales bacterium]|jgi:DNA polymerase-3 subunit delta|nr:DNA polymerase III subunit delta [Bacteroidales bacterium]
MNFEEIKKDIQLKKYFPIYLFYGEEPYFIDELANLIIENVVPQENKSFNQTIIYGKDASIRQIIELARSAPMIDDLQLILVKEAQGLKDYKQDLKENKLLEFYVSNAFPKQTILVFCFKETKSLDKRLKVFKQIEKEGVLFESKKLYDNQIQPWIVEQFNFYKKKISLDAMRLLNEHVGNDLSVLNSEIKKLMVAIPQSKNLVDIDDITNNIGISRQYNVFELEKSLSRKDATTTFKIVDYFDKNIKANPPEMVLPVLYSYFSKVMIVSLLKKEKNDFELATALGVNKFFINDYKMASVNYNIFKLMNIVGYLKEADLKSKGVDFVSDKKGDILKELVYKILYF